MTTTTHKLGADMTRKPLIESPDILERIKGAKERLRDGHALMRIPVDPTDPDCVLADAEIEIERLRSLLARQPAAIDKEAVAWPYEITRGHIECLIADHQRDGQKQLASRLNSSGSYLIRVAESFRWCLEQIDAAPLANEASKPDAPDVEVSLISALGEKYCPPTGKPRYDWLSPTSVDRADLEVEQPAAPSVEQDERGDAPLSLIPELVKQDQRAVGDALLDMGDAMVAWRTEVGKYREITSLAQSAFSDGYEAGIAAILRARAASTSANVTQCDHKYIYGQCKKCGCISAGE